MKAKDNESSSSEFSFFGQDWLSETNTKQRKNNKKDIAVPQKTKSRKTTAHQKRASENVEKFPNQAQFMRVYRVNRGLSQEALGHQWGITDPAVARQTISEIERGRRGIALSIASRLESHTLINSFIKAYVADQRFQILNALRASGIKGLEIR